MHPVYLVFSVLLFLGNLLVPLQAEGNDTAPVGFQYSYARDTSASQESIVIKVDVTINDDYYTYAWDEKEALPTKLSIENVQGIVDANVYYPYAEVQEDSVTDATKQVYTGTFTIFIQLNAAHISKDLFAHISLLLCSANNCIPFTEDIPLKFPEHIPDIADVPWEDTYILYSSEAPQNPQSSISDVELMESTEDSTLINWDFVPHYFEESLEPKSIAIALLFGFIAGIILNMMPCVLPVLTLKVSFMLSQLGSQNEKRCYRSFRIQNICFAAGIISWFFILASGIESIGLAWGGFFQNTVVIFILMLVVFVLALSLFDVFTIPVIDFKSASASHPYIQAYSTGLMTTLLATPCSGPLLGGVLGWAATQSVYVIFVVFFATGLGMSFPYIVLALKPGVIKYIPKPGSWCGKLEKFVGFFLIGTTIYLLTILPQYMIISALAVLFVTAFLAWVWGVWGGLHASKKQKTLVGLSCLGLFLSSLVWAFQPVAKSTWSAYSESTFEQELGSQVLVVKFTADWCPTCKLIEKTVLTPSRMVSLERQYGVKFIKVDLTNKNSSAEKLLRALGSISIPVTAIFPTGEKSSNPTILRDLYTYKQLKQALRNISD